jgi:hypothetical protein
MSLIVLMFPGMNLIVLDSEVYNLMQGIVGLEMNLGTVGAQVLYVSTAGQVNFVAAKVWTEIVYRMIVVRFRQIYVEAGKVVFTVVSVTTGRCQNGVHTYLS